MLAEPISASCVNKLALPGTQRMPQGYFRSKLFIAPFITNPLVAAAMPLLSLLERLCMSPSLPPIAKIRENIEHELHAFHSGLQGKDHTEELDAIAYYLVCATIDELLGKSYLRLYGKPAEFKAFTPTSYDEVGPEHRFFDIVNYIKERPNQYLDLLELSYYCLIAGFEGIQHSKAGGRQMLDNLIEELFQLTQQYRANPSYTLFKETKHKDIGVNNKKPLILGMLISLGLLITSYAITYSFIEKKAKEVHYGHMVVAKLDY